MEHVGGFIIFALTLPIPAVGKLYLIHDHVNVLLSLHYNQVYCCIVHSLFKLLVCFKWNMFFVMPAAKHLDFWKKVFEKGRTKHNKKVVGYCCKWNPVKYIKYIISSSRHSIFWFGKIHKWHHMFV